MTSRSGYSRAVKAPQNGRARVAIARATDSRGRVRWRARYYDPAGHERQKTFDTRRSAEGWLATQRTSISEARWTDPRAGKVRLDTLWERFEQDLLPHRRATTRQNYRNAWKNVASKLGDFPVGSLNHGHVQRFVTELEKGSETTRAAYRVLSLVLDYAVAQNMVAVNVAKGVRLPAASAPRERILTGDELRRLAAALGADGGSRVLAMGLAGLRWSELAALRVASVDLKSRRIHVFETVTFPTGSAERGTTKTLTSRRWVSIPGALKEDLESRIQGRMPTDLVYPAPKGGYEEVGNFRRRVKWDQACAAAGLEAVTPHDLRRSFGSLARLGGADLRYVQKAMGHASITTTARIYAHLYDTEPDQVADGIDRAMQTTKEVTDADENKASGESDSA